MGGGIALLFLGTLFAWLVGCIPFYTLLTVSRSHIHWPIRFLLGMFLSGVAVVLLCWASMEYRNGWIFGAYIAFMVLATVVSILGLIVRWFMRRS
jgi:hypothetical protein